jgi:integrase
VDDDLAGDEHVDVLLVAQRVGPREYDGHTSSWKLMWAGPVALSERVQAGGGPSDADLRAVADVYQLAYVTGGAPTKTVMERLGLPRSTAGRWIALARERGLLGPATPRKAGWYSTTRALRPTTRRDYRVLLDNQVLPAFEQARLADLSLRCSGEMHFLDAVQVEALADAIGRRYPTLVRFAAYSGMRPCELVALRVGRLDLLRGTVRVVEAAPEVAGRLEWGGVKTHEVRTVRLPRFLCEELGAYLAGRPHGPDDLVFTAPLGGPLRESKFVPGYFKPAVRAVRFPPTLRFYDLRHTAASLLIREGSVKAVQKQLGHATASITLDTYGHLFPDELDALAARLEDLHDRALEDRRAADVWPHGGPL